MTESIYNYSIESIEGNVIHLSDFKGKHILMVNVASECGYMAQYAQLQELYDYCKEQLVIIGFPCNQFGGQEPGNNQKIQQFCSVRFGVTFPLTTKIEVKGKNQHPIYQWLTQKSHNQLEDSVVKWNFQKYMINPEGQLTHVFPSSIDPLSDKILSLMNLL